MVERVRDLMWTAGRDGVRGSDNGWWNQMTVPRRVPGAIIRRSPADGRYLRSLIGIGRSQRNGLERFDR